MISAATNPGRGLSTFHDERLSARYDTNIPSELTRIKPDRRVEQWLEAADDNALYLSVISIGEFCKGFAVHPERHRRPGWPDRGHGAGTQTNARHPEREGFRRPGVEILNPGQQ